MRPQMEVSRKKMKSFARLSPEPSAITINLYANPSGYQTPASTMKTLIITCLCSLAFALISVAQSPPPAQAPPAGARTNPAAAQQAPATNVPPGQPGAVGQPAAPGAVTSPAAAGAQSPAASVAASLAPSATPEPPGFLGSNWLIDKFHKGGPIMWPILIVSIIGLTVVIERIFWWGGRWFRRDPK